MPTTKTRKKRQKRIATETTSASDIECDTDLTAADDLPGDAEAQNVEQICVALRSLQRQRRFALKQKIRSENSITAFVAGNACGYHSGIESEKEREKLWNQARKLLKEIDNGPCDAERGNGNGDPSSAADAPDANGELSDDAEKQPANGDVPTVTETDCANIANVVRVSSISRGGWGNYERALVKKMEELAAQLPVASWLSEPECRGIGLGMLATIVGEAGNLSNYENPAKLWKRLFGAPYTKNGKTMMPSRWRLEKGLTCEEWEEIGYSPQRHATMQQLKENIVRQNGEGPYRKRYDEVRERSKTTHPEWWACSKCDGTGKKGKAKCGNCKGTGEVALHAHRHAQLLAAKRFVRDLWNLWTGHEPADGYEHGVVL